MLFKKGHVPHNKGKKMSNELRQKISKSLLGRTVWNKGISTSAIGKSRLKTIKTCLFCNKEFIAKEKSRRYCSRECYIKVQVERNKKHPSVLGKKLTIEHRRKLSKSHEGKTGEKSSHWKGGITNQNKLERGRFRITIQKLVFERDSYSCVLCGNKKDLQVDHIQSWAEYVELRFSIDNCRTLCSKCHYKVTYGREMPKTIKTWGHNLERRFL